MTVQELREEFYRHGERRCNCGIHQYQECMQIQVQILMRLYAPVGAGLQRVRIPKALSRRHQPTND